MKNIKNINWFIILIKTLIVSQWYENSTGWNIHSIKTQAWKAAETENIYFMPLEKSISH